MYIAVPDTCILGKSNQLIKYSSLVTHRLRPQSKNRMPSVSLSCSTGKSEPLKIRTYLLTSVNAYKHYFLVEFSSLNEYVSS